ncbi:MAG: hypothetical protein CSA22_03545 [Deltaproteobacteria bacterium]|nr:MAG: hypothetical protein CSA22_03545 [Deltaproteobacteria bacterium]
MSTNTPVSTLMHTEIVPPTRGGNETRWLFAIAAFTLIICGLTVNLRTRGTAEKHMESWQVNAFTGLSAQELGTFNALRTAAIEIDEVHDDEDSRWMGIAELAELYMPPFVQDAAWQNQGRLKWSLKIVPAQSRHIALYLGTPEAADKSGTFLLIMLHDHIKKQGNAPAVQAHAPSEIWLHKRANATFPEVVTDQALISAGWREVVALKGEDEIKRVKGEMI